MRRKIKSVCNTLDIENAENVIPDLQRPTHVPSYQFPFSTQMNIEMIYNRMAYFLLFCQRDLRFLSKKKKKQLRSSDKESRETTYANFTILIREILDQK